MKRGLKLLVAGILSVSMAFAATAEAKKKIEVKYGAKVTSNGFADLGKTKYASKKNVIIIDDENYKTAKEKRTAFTNAIASGSVKDSSLTDKEAFIIVKGLVDLSDGQVSDDDHSFYEKFDPETHKRINKDIIYKVGSNKTIIGQDNAKIAYGGIEIRATAENPAKNIVIRNILFWDAHGATDMDTSFKSDSKASIDQLLIQGTPTKDEKGKDTGAMTYVPSDIWIDHCSFTDGICVDLDRNYSHDGALDVKAVHNLTVSFCEFTNHDKVTLVGPSDKFIEPTDRQITFHDNYYHGTVQRMPRSRGCQIHIYNNYYDQIGTDNNKGYSLGPGVGSLFIVENNYFGAHRDKIVRCFDSSVEGEPTFYKIYNSGNSPELDAQNSEQYERHHVATKPWKISYKYSAKKASELDPSAAGSGCEVVIK